MSLKKSILHGKEKRKPYRGWLAVSKSCRPNGGDPWYTGNRLNKYRAKEKEMKKDIRNSDLELAS